MICLSIFFDVTEMLKVFARHLVLNNKSRRARF
jgi:hypothetical protein